MFGGRIKMLAENQELLEFKPPKLLITNFCQEHQVSEEEATERFEETKKFLYICARRRSESYAPSIKIDEMWHQFILHTTSYFEFCEKAGGYLHHIPSENPEIKFYKRTLKDMKSFYGKLNSVYWSEQNASAGHCGHCSSCGSN